MKNFEFGPSKKVILGRSEADLVGGEMITNSVFGDAADITRVDLKFGNHAKTFVMKDYGQNNTNFNTDKESASYSASVWKKLRSIGLPTYTTYRLEQDGTAVLMTDLDKDGYKALSINHAGQDWYDGDERIQKIISIVNFSQLIDEIKACAEKASAVGISLESDAYFILVKSVTQGAFEAEIFIGDFEGVLLPADVSDSSSFDAYGESISKEEIVINSLQNARDTLLRFVAIYMPENSARKYIEEINSAFN